MSEETVSPKENETRIKWGLGAMIADVAENQEILQQVREAPLLSPKSLIKLAAFYKMYRGNEQLADRLALSIFCLVILTDGQEDYCKGMDPHDPEDRAELDAVSLKIAEGAQVISSIGFKWVSVFGIIGLLVEVSQVAGIDGFVYYGVGVGPDPNTLD